MTMAPAWVTVPRSGAVGVQIPAMISSPIGVRLQKANGYQLSTY